MTPLDPQCRRGQNKLPGKKKKNWVLLALKIRKLRAKGIRGQALYEQAADELGLRGGWESIRDAYYRRPKKVRDMMEYATASLEAQVREKIRSPDGKLLVSLEEYEAWLEHYFKAHKP